MLDRVQQTQHMLATLLTGELKLMQPCWAALNTAHFYISACIFNEPYGAEREGQPYRVAASKEGRHCVFAHKLKEPF